MGCPNFALDAVCECIEELDLSVEEIDALCADLRAELRERADQLAEAAWEAAHDPETIASRAASYRADIINAGRGHLLGD